MKLSLNSFFHAIGFALHKCKFDNIFLKVKQYKILDALMSGRDVIGVLPTGYGKSIIYQLLPFIYEYHSKNESSNIVIVVSPLNALMNDQVKFLRSKGVSAGMFKTKQAQKTPKDETNNDSDSASDESDYEEDAGNELLPIHQGKFRILFIHPEGFISCREGRNVFLNDTYQKNVVCSVIDEAHLVEEWGGKFRLDFRKLCQLRALFPSTPILALTASAPPKNIALLISSLQLQNPLKVIGNLDRQNIYIKVCKRKSSVFGTESYEEILSPIAEELKTKLLNYPLTIIYLPLKWCGYAFKLFSQILQEKSFFPASEKGQPSQCLFAQFHAAQTDRMKSEILNQLTGACETRNLCVVFATVALGLGVNIPDVRQIIHIGPPRTVESYYQEIGRAGRDGKLAKAILYYNGSDIATNVSGMTDEMRAFCSTVKSCLREYMLNYLGSTRLHKYLPHSCCSNCAIKCKCKKCQDMTSQLELSGDTVTETPTKLNQVRDVSKAERDMLIIRMKKYRLELGHKYCQFGSIDLNTGFTLAVIDSIASQANMISTAEQMFKMFPMWNEEHAIACMQIIKDVCGE